MSTGIVWNLTPDDKPRLMGMLGKHGSQRGLLLALLLIGVVSAWVFAHFLGAVGWSDRVLYAEPREVPFAVSNQSRNIEPSLLGGQWQQSGLRILDRIPNACCRNDQMLLGSRQWWAAIQSRGTENRFFSHARDSSIFASIFKKSADAFVCVISSDDDNRTRSGFKHLTRQYIRLIGLSRIETNDQKAHYFDKEGRAVHAASKVFSEYVLPAFRAIKELAYLCVAIFLTGFGLSILQFRPPRDWSSRVRNATLIFGLVMLIVGQVFFWSFLVFISA